MKMCYIQEAKREAEKLIERCDNVIARSKDDDGYCLHGCRETGDLRRQSMELTRSLTRLRK